MAGLCNSMTVLGLASLAEENLAMASMDPSRTVTEAGVTYNRTAGDIVPQSLPVGAVSGIMAFRICVLH